MPGPSADEERMGLLGAVMCRRRALDATELVPIASAADSPPSSVLVKSPSFSTAALPDRDDDHEDDDGSSVGDVEAQLTTTKKADSARSPHSTIAGACFAIIKCMVGPAALYMPHGFAEAGLGGALVIVLIANVLFAAGVSRLLAAWRARAGSPCARDAADLAGELAGPACRWLVKFSVCSLQMGVCVTYFVFVSETAREVWRTAFPSSSSSSSKATTTFSHGRLADFGPPSMAMIVVLMVLLEAPAATVRQIRKLARANVAGTALVAASLLIIAGAALHRLKTRGVADDWQVVEKPAPTVVFAGTAVFAFEGGAAVVIPVANSVAPRDRDRLLRATLGCIFGVALAYTLFATSVYLAFGKSVPVVASRALGGSSDDSEAEEEESSSWPDLVVNGVYVVVALLSFPLQLLPAAQILFPATARENTEEEDDEDVVDDDDVLVVIKEEEDLCGGGGGEKGSLPLAAVIKQQQQQQQPVLAETPKTQNRVNDDAAGPEPEDDAVTKTTQPKPAFTTRLAPLARVRVVPSPSTRSSAARRRRLVGDAQRVGLVLLLGATAAVARHSLDHVVALLGAVSCGPLALVVGPWMHLNVATTRAARLLDKAIIAAGTLVTVLTLLVTLASWGHAQS